MILVACLLSGCTDAENGELTDLAHAAVHEMRLKIDECGDSPSCVMINFPDGSVLTTEHFPESGRLRSWTVR